MLMCECPLCDRRIELEGYEENDLIDCPECSVKLEIVSLTPPVLEEVAVEEEGWE